MNIALSLRTFGLFLSVATMLATPYAAAGDSKGKVHGIVRDPNGGVMSLHIQIVPDEPSDVQHKITLSTDQFGKYAAELPAGQYKICAAHRGLEETCDCVRIEEGRDVERNLSMRVDKSYVLPSDYDVIDRRLQLLAGKDAINCGHADVNRSTRKETDCALSAHKRNKPFAVRYDVKCGDCVMSFGLAADELGRLFAVRFDSMGMSTWELRPTEMMPDGIFTVVAPCPPHPGLRATVTGALSCFSKNETQNIMQQLDDRAAGYTESK